MRETEESERERERERGKDRDRERATEREREGYKVKKVGCFTTSVTTAGCGITPRVAPLSGFEKKNLGI